MLTPQIGCIAYTRGVIFGSDIAYVYEKGKGFEPSRVLTHG
jgi:hypothetical protein